jgi:hypothetical protein
MSTHAGRKSGWISPAAAKRLYTFMGISHTDQRMQVGEGQSLILLTHPQVDETDAKKISPF